MGQLLVSGNLDVLFTEQVGDLRHTVISEQISESIKLCVLLHFLLGMLAIELGSHVF